MKLSYFEVIEPLELPIVFVIQDCGLSSRMFVQCATHA